MTSYQVDVAKRMVALQIAMDASGLRGWRRRQHIQRMAHNSLGDESLDAIAWKRLAWNTRSIPSHC